MSEFITACDCGCSGVEKSADFDLSVTLNDEVDRQAHLRARIPEWLEGIPFRNESDVKSWEREGYRPRDIINRLREEKEVGEPLENFDPWPDKTRDPRSSNPYPVSISNSAVRTYSSDEGFDWDLSVGE